MEPRPPRHNTEDKNNPMSSQRISPIAEPIAIPLSTRATWGYSVDMPVSKRSDWTQRARRGLPDCPDSAQLAPIRFHSRYWKRTVSNCFEGTSCALVADHSCSLGGSGNGDRSCPPVGAAERQNALEACRSGIERRNRRVRRPLGSRIFRGGPAKAAQPRQVLTPALGRLKRSPVISGQAQLL